VPLLAIVPKILHAVQVSVCDSQLCKLTSGQGQAQKPKQMAPAAQRQDHLSVRAWINGAHHTQIADQL
jgi:hypothetical protein